MIKIKPANEFIASVMRCAPHGYLKISISKGEKTILEQTFGSFEFLLERVTYWVMTGEIPLSLGKDINRMIEGITNA